MSGDVHSHQNGGTVLLAPSRGSPVRPPHILRCPEQAPMTKDIQVKMSVVMRLRKPRSEDTVTPAEEENLPGDGADQGSSEGGAGGAAGRGGRRRQEGRGGGRTRTVLTPAISLSFHVAPPSASPGSLPPCGLDLGSRCVTAGPGLPAAGWEGWAPLPGVGVGTSPTWVWTLPL